MWKFNIFTNQMLIAICGSYHLAQFHFSMTKKNDLEFQHISAFLEGAILTFQGKQLKPFSYSFHHNLVNLNFSIIGANVSRHLKNVNSGNYFHC